MKVLLLNQGYQPVGSVSWEKAICMVFRGKAEMIEPYESQFIRTVSEEFEMPAVLRLFNYNKIGPSIIKFSRENVYLRDNHTCQYCGEFFMSRKLTLDHVIPRAKGGKTIWTNIITACKDCNTKKADKTPSEAGMPLLNKPFVPTSAHSTSKNYLSRGSKVPDEWENWI